MAVYGRHKEKWDPTRPKSKTTKNRTYELKKTSSLGGTFLTSDKLHELIKFESVFDVNGDEIPTASGYIISTDNKELVAGNNIVVGGDYVSIEEIEASRYREKAMHFRKIEDPNGGFYRSYIRPSQANSKYTGSIFGGPRAYTTYISFWLRLNSSDFEGSDGHSFGGLYRSGETDDDTGIGVQDPILLFSVSTDGQLIIRHLGLINENVDPQPDGTYTPGHITWSVPTDDKMIKPDEWVYCTVGFTPVGTNNLSDSPSSVYLWINGNSVELSVNQEGTPYDTNSGLEWRLGNTGNTFDSRIGANLHLSDGFSGSLGEISLISQSHTTVEEWNAFSKFLYEAYKDGVYALHSGAHNSGPSRLLINKYLDTSYPPSDILRTYNKVNDDHYFGRLAEPAWKEATRTSQRSSNYFVEGYNTSDAGYEWEENASQYFINSEKKIPYLGVNPQDTILTNGNWYSDARSEFFAEDLSESTGLVIQDSKTSTRLYRKNVEDKAAKFIEEYIPPEYKDCIVLEIPIPSVSSLTLSTDADGNTERRQLGDGVFQSSQQSINTMAYYNFETNQWEHTCPSYSTDGTGVDATPANYNWVNKGDIGFGPMTGLVLPEDQDDVEYIVDLYGRPISDFGFPFADKFSSNAGQSIDLGKYISEPVVLEGWEIYQKVVPVVGYQHDGNTEEGPDIYYNVSNIYNTSTEVGSRTKVRFSPGSPTPALTAVTVPGIQFVANYGSDHELIDVYYASEMQKGGSLADVTAGTADYCIGPDAASDGLLQFRYPLAANADITVVVRELGGGTRTKVFVNPPETVAGTAITIAGTTFGASPDQNLIDVYFNGELQRNGTEAAVTAGTADVSLSDISSIGHIKLRYNVTSSDIIAVVVNTLAVANEAGEVSGQRQKATYSYGSDVSAGTYISTNGIALADYGYSNNQIEVYHNGELQNAGTEIQVTNGTADYFIGTDSSSIGQIKFRYNIVAEDNIIVVARNMGTSEPESVGGIGTGRNPFYYGAHGHSTVMWNYNNLASPFTEEFHADSQTGEWFHHNTVPIFEDTIDLQTKSIVTKGVTAFLLKESRFVDKDERKANFHQKPRRVSLSTNLSTNSGANWNAPNAGNDSISDTYIPMDTSLISMDYESDSMFDTQNTRSLIGYLQHVYHNDTNPTGSRSSNDWMRNGFNGELVGELPRYSNQLNLVGILDRENATYISNILRENTQEYTFHVSGSMKITNQIDASFPITNFRLSDIYNVSSIDAPENNNPYHVQALFGSNEGGVDLQLTNPESIPSMTGIAEKKIVNYPIQAIPSDTSGATGSQLASWKQDKVAALDGSKNQIEAAETILNPSDKLILGIQDSVSTCFASQQNKAPKAPATEDDTNFVRWGRNSLTIPAQNDSYIRLYIKKTRRDKTFNRLSTTKGYNANVSRCLGDHDVADKHFLNAPSIFSGSISDDIIGPTFFTPPIIEQKISAVGSSLDGADPFGGGDIYVAWAFGWSNITQWRETIGAGHSYRNHDPGVPDVTEWQEGDQKLPWYTLSRKVLADTETAPAIHMQTNLPFDPRSEIAESFANSMIGIIVHPQNMRIGVFAPYARWGMGTICVLDEINTNSTSPIDWTNYSYTDKLGNVVTKDWGGTERTGFDSNGAGAWYQTIAFPLFEKLDHRYDPQFITVPVTFRLVQIGTWNRITVAGYPYAGSDIPANFPEGRVYNGDGQDNLNAINIEQEIFDGKYPVYSDGSEMDIGDVFYFDDNNESVKLLNISQLDENNIPDNQKILRTWRGHKTEGQEVYIVARKGELFTIGSVGSRPQFMNWSETSQLEGGARVGQTLTYNDVYDKIAEVLNAQKLIEDSILYTSVESNVDGNFLNIKYPDDPVIRAVLEGGKTFIDSQNQFTLLNQSGLASNSAFLQEEIWLKKKSGDTSNWWITGYGGNETYDAHFHPSRDPANGNPIYPGHNADQNDSDTWLPSVLQPNVDNTYLKGYFRTFGFGGSGASEPWNDRFYDLTDLYPPNSGPGGGLVIDYTGLPSDNIAISIVQETYNDTDTNTGANGADVRDIIDRKVAFRTTEKSAGPFGSLNPFLSLNGEANVHDSKYPAIQETGLVELKLAENGFDQGWILDGLEEKRGPDVAFRLNNITITLGAENDPNGYEGTYEPAVSQDGLPLVTTSMTPDTKGVNDWVFGESSDSGTNWPSPISNRLMNVTNYIQKEFGGNKDFTSKTGKDLLFGIGNGVANRHTVRPAVYKYGAFRTNDENNLVVDTPSPLVLESVIDPPRGVRFGLWNTSPVKMTYKFNSRSYGNFRDMYEQALDTRFSDNMHPVKGAPVIVTGVQPTDPTKPMPLSDTKRYNKTKHATITIPFIEENYEATPQPMMLSGNVRVDVPGRIRQREVLGPGNLNASIFKRS